MKDENKEANKGKEKLTYEELMGQLKDPALLQAAAAKLGLTVTKPETKKKEEEKPFELPSIELDPDEYKPEQLTEGLNKALSAIVNHLTKSIETSVSGVRSEMTQQTQQSEAQKLRAFAAKTEHLKEGSEHYTELLSIMEPLYQRSGDIKDAYTKAIKAIGLEDKTFTEKEPETDEEGGSSKISSLPAGGEENLNDKTLKKDIKTVGDAAKLRVEEALADKGEDFFSADEE